MQREVSQDNGRRTINYSDAVEGKMFLLVKWYKTEYRTVDDCQMLFSRIKFEVKR